MDDLMMSNKDSTPRTDDGMKIYFNNNIIIIVK